MNNQTIHIRPVKLMLPTNDIEFASFKRMFKFTNLATLKFAYIDTGMYMQYEDCIPYYMEHIVNYGIGDGNENIIIDSMFLIDQWRPYCFDVLIDIFCDDPKYIDPNYYDPREWGPFADELPF